MQRHQPDVKGGYRVELGVPIYTREGNMRGEAVVNKPLHYRQLEISGDTNLTPILTKKGANQLRLTPRYYWCLERESNSHGH